MTGMVYVPWVADEQAATKEVRLVFSPACTQMLPGGVFVSQWKTWSKQNGDTLQTLLVARTEPWSQTRLHRVGAEYGKHTRAHMDSTHVQFIMDLGKFSVK